MAPEKQMAKLQKDNVLFQAQDESRCEEEGCGRHHHRNMHWQVAVGRLFQVNMSPESYELGSQIFTLTQNLAIEPAAKRTLVTERSTRKMGFQKLEGRAAVVGFSGTMPTFDDMYEASVTKSIFRRR
jgi:hypothetical protein